MRGVISSVTVTSTGTVEMTLPLTLVCSATTCWVPSRPRWEIKRTPLLYWSDSTSSVVYSRVSSYSMRSVTFTLSTSLDCKACSTIVVSCTEFVK